MSRIPLGLPSCVPGIHLAGSIGPCRHPKLLMHRPKCRNPNAIPRWTSPLRRTLGAMYPPSTPTQSGAMLSSQLLSLPHVPFGWNWALVCPVPPPRLISHLPVPLRPSRLPSRMRSASAFLRPLLAPPRGMCTRSPHIHRQAESGSQMTAQVSVRTLFNL